MYPTDDRFIRIRLLIKESREARERMMKRVEEFRKLRARATQRLIERTERATDEGRAQPGSRGGGAVT